MDGYLERHNFELFFCGWIFLLKLGSVVAREIEGKNVLRGTEFVNILQKSTLV